MTTDKEEYNGLSICVTSDPENLANGQSLLVVGPGRQN